MRTSDLDKVAAAVAKVTKDENPTTWEFKSKGYYDIPSGNLGLAGIVIEPTRDLLRFQQKLIDVVAPFTSDNGTDLAFVPKSGGGAMVSGLVDYVTAFVRKSTGKNFNPHVTIGLGTTPFVENSRPHRSSPSPLRHARLVSTAWLFRNRPALLRAFARLIRCRRGTTARPRNPSSPLSRR